jgi:hypothetical protein
VEALEDRRLLDYGLAVGPNVNIGPRVHHQAEAELARREGCDYEPAAALLERIRAKREQNSQPKRTRR